MAKKLIILGSTGSIGRSTLKVINKNKSRFKILLLTTNNNIVKILKQAIKFNVKKIVVGNKDKFKKLSYLFKNRKIKVYFNITEALKTLKIKSDFTICSISGIDGLEPTINAIKFTKNLGIANKESIICGWKFIKRDLDKYKTNFIPLDSEHFSIWSLLNHENKKNIKKIYLTASGGPFLKRRLSDLKNIKPKYALRHPNWSMGKKISIDSATMMNKIFEVIEAKKIFNLDENKFQILIHPKSYIHAIIHFQTGITKILAHKTTMEIPIINYLHKNKEKFVYDDSNFDFKKLNGNNFLKPDEKKFPLLKILKYKYNNTFFEIILVTINDTLVNLYLENSIKYINIHRLLISLLKKSYFTRYYKVEPKNINEIKNMILKVKIFMNKYLNKYGT